MKLTDDDKRRIDRLRAKFVEDIFLNGVAGDYAAAEDIVAMALISLEHELDGRAKKYGTKSNPHSGATA